MVGILPIQGYQSYNFYSRGLLIGAGQHHEIFILKLNNENRILRKRIRNNSSRNSNFGRKFNSLNVTYSELTPRTVLVLQKQLQIRSGITLLMSYPTEIGHKMGQDDYWICMSHLGIRISLQNLNYGKNYSYSFSSSESPAHVLPSN